MWRGVNTQRNDNYARFSLYYTTVPLYQLFKLITNCQHRESEFRTFGSFETLPQPRQKDSFAYQNRNCACFTRCENHFCRNDHVVARASPPTSLRIIWIVWMYQPSTSYLHMYLTHRAIIFQSIDYLCRYTYRSVSTCFCISFFLSFFFLLFFPWPETRTRTRTRSCNVEDCFLFRFDENDENSFDFAGRDIRRKMIRHGSTLLKFDRELSILANPAGDERLLLTVF